MEAEHEKVEGYVTQHTNKGGVWAAGTVLVWCSRSSNSATVKERRVIIPTRAIRDRMQCNTFCFTVVEDAGKIPSFMTKGKSCRRTKKSEPLSF